MNSAPFVNTISAEIWQHSIVLYNAQRLPRVAQHQIMVDAYVQSRGGDYGASREVAISAFPATKGDGWARYEMLRRDPA